MFDLLWKTKFWINWFDGQQEGSLCGQHCLNGLLQGEYFTAVDLAQLAQQIDEEERHRMAEGGENREEYQRFIEVCIQLILNIKQLINNLFVLSLPPIIWMTPVSSQFKSLPALWRSGLLSWFPSTVRMKSRFQLKITRSKDRNNCFEKMFD